MDNFELIAFVIGILYFLFGSSKKKKERPKPHHRAPKRTESTPSLEDILRELTGQQTLTKPQVEEQPVHELEKTQQAKPKPAEEVAYTDPLVHHARTGKPISAIRKEIRKEKGLEVETSTTEFDLRQAVINDAILRRPYGDPLP